jgi:NADH dehydrogenase
VRTGTAVARVTENGVETNRGAIASKTVIWSGGVQAYDMTLAAAKPLGRDEKTRRISVSSLLSIPVYPEVYVVGDQALIPNLKTGKPYGMRAQHATEEGRHAARNILLRIRGYAQEAFLYRERGTILSLGRGGALADIWGMRFSGFLARVIYRAAYLKAIVGTRAKLRTALEWCLNFFTPRDISKI